MLITEYFYALLHLLRETFGFFYIDSNCENVNVALSGCRVRLFITPIKTHLETPAQRLRPESIT